MILLHRSTTGSSRARHRLGAALLAATLAVAPLTVLGAPASAASAAVAPEGEPATGDAPAPKPTPTPEPSPEPEPSPSAEADEPASAPKDEPDAAPEPKPEAEDDAADEAAADKAAAADSVKKAAPRKKKAAARAIEHTGERYEGAGGTVFYVPTTVAPGEPIRVSGTGWQTAAGDAGSVIALKLDAGAVSTKLEVRHPVTDAVQPNKTIIAIAAAEANGEWEVELPFPTLDSSTAAWEVGQTHGVQLLTGSLTEGDVRRTEVASFTVAADGDEAATPPTWSHDTVIHTDGSGRVATAWVENQLAAGNGTTIRVKGTGWTSSGRTQGSTIALKLNSGVGQQYTRPAGQVVEHPTASGDDTIWALLTKSDAVPRPHVYDIDDAGNFEIELDAPAGLTAGQYLTMQLQSGRFLTGDVQRSVVSQPLVVGGIPWVDDGGAGENITCVPTTAGPTITIEEPSVELGGRLHVTGTGWCHPAENGGGSIVAVKIDEGKNSRLDTSVHQNKTIWTLLPADPATGRIDAEIQLPDGTTSGPNGSDPAFTEGSHRLRLLTGSLKPGDTVRTLESDPFTVGAYSPNGIPDPLEYTEDLTTANRMGLTVSRGPTALKVTVDGASKGDWVFLSAYGKDGSARFPWNDTWFQADSRGVVTAPLSGTTLPTGTSKLVAQSGNRGEVGQLLGWAPLTVKAPAAGSTEKPKPEQPAAPAAPVQRRTTAPKFVPAPGALVPTAAPVGVPAAPFPDASGLTPANSGSVSGTQDGTIVTITIPSVDAGDWVYLYAYSTTEAKSIAVGWVQTDSARQVKVDVALLPAGQHKLALIGSDGVLIGWTSATVTADETLVEPEPAPPAPAAASAAKPLAAAKDELLSAADGWLLVAGLLVLLGASGATIWVRHTRPVAQGGQS